MNLMKLTHFIFYLMKLNKKVIRKLNKNHSSLPKDKDSLELL